MKSTRFQFRFFVGAYGNLQVSSMQRRKYEKVCEKVNRTEIVCLHVFNWQKLSPLKGSRQVQRSFECVKSTDMILTHILIRKGAFGHCRHRKKTHIFFEETQKVAHQFQEN